VAEICQNRTAGKDQFFENLLLLKSKSTKTNESQAITWGMCTRNRRSKQHSENFHEFLRCSAGICFGTATSPNLTFHQLEVLVGTKPK
jgi:hypothetical protein